jgi:hypothetical protein
MITHYAGKRSAERYDMSEQKIYPIDPSIAENA